MTISTTTNRVRTSGDGATVAFSFPYYVESASDLDVYVTTSAGVETLQTITTHYSVTGAGSASVTVTFVSAPSASETVTIVRSEPFVQELNASSIGTFRSQGFEDNYDRVVRMTQRIWDKLGRTLHFKASSAHTDIEVPELSASKYLKVNSGATGVEWVSSVGWSIQGAWATSTAYSVDDVVSNDGSSYICTQTHTSGASTEPGTGGSWASYWSLVAAKGSTGDPGADGNDGSDGVFAGTESTVTLDSANDLVPIYDNSDSNNPKKVAASEFVSAGVGWHVQLHADDAWLSGSSDATLTTQNAVPCVSYAGASGDKRAYWTFVLPTSYAGGGLTVKIHWNHANSTGDVDFECGFQPITGDSQTPTVPTNNAARNLTTATTGQVATITFTDGADANSIAAGDAAYLFLQRDGATDTSTDAAYVYAIEIYETPA